MAEALAILGYQAVYHGLRLNDSPSDQRILGRAAEATFSVLPTYTGRPIFGSCEAATDMAAVFAPQLIGVYPKAKVILVIRDFEAWSASVEDVIFK
ncbi:hypothetical protein HRG_011539 [Hirsutella rhossiliensis]|uniref:Uncharacterized protein n=1 Tax=Hirsutella rhossiliensis TaxID=111463 RepID=A0A9P8ML87_9HYPO|nr:uncharacterized protein HRG_11539 [Hirsutella rhossiliensis]KAH0957392.1 hypothetical protein HRG_11539 [Hirsutella rhossiliensis]